MHVITKLSCREFCSIPREVGGEGWGFAHNEELDDAAEKGKREGCMKQNPARGGEKEEEEDEEEVERGSVGRLRRQEMLYNQLSRVFSSILFLLTFLTVFLSFGVIPAYSPPSALSVSALLSSPEFSSLSE